MHLACYSSCMARGHCTVSPCSGWTAVCSIATNLRQEVWGLEAVLTEAAGLCHRHGGEGTLTVHRAGCGLTWAGDQ